MKTVKIYALQFPNGDLLLGVTGTNRENMMFFVQTSDGIFEYSYAEVDEIYGYTPQSNNLVGKLVTETN